VRNDRLNREAPTPPLGEMTPPDYFTDAERAIWGAVIANAPAGMIRPLDSGLLERYCWDYVRRRAALLEHRAWCLEKKKPGETDSLRLAENGVLGRHPILGVIESHAKAIAQAEAKLGLTPVDRERIRAATQKELPFDDPWATLELPGETPTQ